MAVTIDIGALRQVVTLSNPGVPVPDGDGGYTQPYAPLDPPTWRAAIEAASVRASERHFAATVTAHASYILSGRFHPGIDTKTRMVWTDRAGEVHTANVLDVDDTEGAGVETVVLVSEVVA
jgi:hypothetical protein